MLLTDAPVLDLFRRQHGVASRSQLIGAGVHRSIIGRALKRRMIVDVFRGVYRYAVTPESPDQRLVAATLAVDGAAVSHRSAAWLHGLAGFKRLEGIEVSTLARSEARGVRVHETTDLPPSAIELLRGVRTTRVGRTLLDLCEVCERRVVARAMDDALRRSLVSYETLRRLAAERGQGRRGVTLARDLLSERGPEDRRAASELESAFLRLLRRAELPLPPLINVDFHDKSGQRIARPDFAYPEWRVVIFLDGKQFHSDATAFENDRGQGNALTDRGWRVFRWTWRQVHDDEASVVATLRRAFATGDDASLVLHRHRRR